MTKSNLQEFINSVSDDIQWALGCENISAEDLELVLQQMAQDMREELEAELPDDEQEDNR
jgi:hypothetical protein